jgi:hypothetical protein
MTQTAVVPQASPRAQVRQPVPKIVLPTERHKPSLTFDTAKTLLFGPEGVGKTTFAVNVNPDSTMLIGAEAGYGAIDAFVQPVGTWDEFLLLGAALAQDAAAGADRRFVHYAVDTVDELHRMCQDYICAKLGIKHPSDLEYGAGWGAVGDEFKLRMGKLCSLGAGVTFVSHAKDEEIKQRVGTITKTVPQLSGAPAKWLAGFVDYVFFATIVGDDDGEQRVIRTEPSVNWAAKQRIPQGLPHLPDPLPLDAAAVRDAMAEAFGSSPQPEPEAQTDAEPEAKAKA